MQIQAKYLLSILRNHVISCWTAAVLFSTQLLAQNVSIRLLLAAVVLGILAVATPLAAQDQHTVRTTALREKQTALGSHGPGRLIRHYDRAATYTNWSGYAVVGASFTVATGSWTVPAIECAKRPANSFVSLWVGIDGYNAGENGTVEQTGTNATCDPSILLDPRFADVCLGVVPCYFGWFEFFPDSNMPCTTFRVSPGDVVSGAVSYDDTTDKFTTTLTNGGQTCGGGPKQVAGAQRSTAEWIAEAPGNPPVPLADFGRVSFASSYAAEESPSGPVVVVPGNGDAISLVSDDGNEEAAPFSLTPDGTGFSVQSLFTVSNFNGTKESFPASSLVQGLDGNLYGTTFLGGNSQAPYCNGGVDLVGCGTVFMITPDGTLTTIYSFCPNPDPAGNCEDGAFPSGALLLGVDGNFYGTTQGGGSRFGTVYKLSREPRGGCPGGTNSGNGWCETTLYTFCSLAACADGGDPIGALVQANDGNFYGTTYSGGLDNDPFCKQFPGCGTVFKITPNGSLTSLYEFCSQANCADGANPRFGLVQGKDGNFYGMSSAGGANSFGTLFQLSPAGELLTLHSFCSLANCADGNYPNGPLVLGGDGNFYGTTLTGGNQNGPDCDFSPGPGQPVECGTVFRLTRSGAFTTLYKFCSESNCADGANPASGLVQGSDGNLYGTTAMFLCAASPCFTDTIFEITTSGTLTTLFANCLLTLSGQFCGSDYNNPLDQLTDGSLYGTAKVGGSGVCLGNSGPPFFCGTVFNLSVGLRPFVGVFPTSGVVGSKITIIGNGLASTSSVNVNGGAADFTIVSDTELTAVVPPGAARRTRTNIRRSAGQAAGFVTVTTSSGTLTSNVPFRVSATATLGLAPASVSVGSTGPIVMTANVTPPSGSGIPTGTVTFFNGQVPIGANTLTNGIATLDYNPSSLAAGTYSITVLYGGDDTFGGSVSAPQELVVVLPTFTVGGTAVSVSPGATNGNTSTITVTPSGGFTGNVTLAATITSSPAGAQDPPTLSFGSTSPVDITGTSAGTATLTISTTAATSSALAYPVRPGVRWYATGGAGLALALVFGMGIPTRRRSGRARLGLLILLVIFAGGLIACGSSGGGGGRGGNPGTTPGAYTVTVTGTSGSTKATGTVTLTVQ